ncbi:MAG: Hsp33 family molecular chaperone HslO [Alphaproteobacteria bacterium]
MTALGTNKRRYTPAPADDFVLPFDLPELGLRGRMARLGAVATRALSARPLPERAQRTLGEALALAALLGTSLKQTGRMSVQTKSEGPLNLLTADFVAGGGLRGYARLDAERFAQLNGDGGFGSLTGAGVLAITIEPKPGPNAYQGVVPLAAEGLAASAEHYFDQSEQLATALRLVAAPLYRAGQHGWCAGGMMVQAMPEKPGDVRESDEWQRIALFMQTLEDYELLDSAVAAEDVLWHLFHEDEVRVHNAQTLHFHCGCGPEKVSRVLASYARDELADLAEDDGVIRARCEFCGAVYEFPLAEFNT